MHYDESMVQLVREMLVVALKIAAPMLAAGVVVGLTISIVQSVTSDHGGTISVQSQPPHGTTFLVELPRNLDKLHAPVLNGSVSVIQDQ
jgi:light-regulated signal transduction histidine kinase (bacteriophytochrome)